ncbi:unnamed protein product [Closterium sp. Yama58-4]|nr:unnamed protein product [Closterium sp. Yama58-4]
MLARRTVETLDIAEGGGEEGSMGRELGGGRGGDGRRAHGLCVDGAIADGSSSSRSSGSSSGSGVSNHPSTFVSAKTGRGPFKPGWQAHSTPLMTAYKVVTVDVPYWGFGSRLEKYIAKVLQRRLSLETNQAVVCWMDEWIGLSEQQVRAMEEHTFARINKVGCL